MGISMLLSEDGLHVHRHCNLLANLQRNPRNCHERSRHLHSHPNLGSNKAFPASKSRQLYVQGDHSGCSLGCVDIKTKVPFQYVVLTLKQNFCFDVNNT